MSWTMCRSYSCSRKHEKMLGVRYLDATGSIFKSLYPNMSICVRLYLYLYDWKNKIIRDEVKSHNMKKMNKFRVSYAFRASCSVRHSDEIQALSQPGGILFIAALMLPKGLISATWKRKGKKKKKLWSKNMQIKGHGYDHHRTYFI